MRTCAYYMLLRTSKDCPEQYEVFRNNKLCGYIRVRFNTLTVEYPDCLMGTIISTDSISGYGSLDNNERDSWLNYCIRIIDNVHRPIGKKIERLITKYFKVEYKIKWYIKELNL